MSRVRPIPARPNLPVQQQMTQRLTDAFNADEQAWKRLAPLRRLRRLLHSGQSRRKQKQQYLADFARAQPSQDAVASWRVEP
jgi:hypothetical protein